MCKELTPRTIARENALNWAYVVKHLSYKPETGEFHRIFERAGRGYKKFRPFNHYRNASRQVLIKLSGDFFLASRLAWRFYYGEWPPVKLRHLNGDRDDLRIANLALDDPLM